MNDSTISRRHILTAAGAAAALNASRASLAQEQTAEIPEQVTAAIASATYRAEDVLTEICVDDDFDVVTAVSRIEEAQTFVAAVLDPDKLRISRETISMHCLYRHEFYYMNHSFHRLEVSTTRIDKTSYVAPNEVKVADDENDSCWDVFQAIFLETLGVDKALRKGVTEAFKRVGIDKLAGEVAKAAQAKQWSKTAQLLRRIVLRLLGKRFLQALESRLSKVAFQKFLRAVGSRFVPWVGPALLVVSLVVAIKVNYSALSECEF